MGYNDLELQRQFQAFQQFQQQQLASSYLFRSKFTYLPLLVHGSLIPDSLYMALYFVERNTYMHFFKEKVQFIFLNYYKKLIFNLINHKTG